MPLGVREFKGSTQVGSGTSTKAYTYNEVHKLDNQKTYNIDKKLLLIRLLKELKIVNQEYEFINQKIKSYDKYNKLVEDFYNTFGIYEAPLINKEKENKYTQYNPVIFSWHEDQYIWHDKNTNTLYIS